MHATKYKNIYLICIFLIRFIYSVHIIQVFYNINTQRRRLCPLFYKSVIRNLAADTKRLLSVLYSITAKNIHKLQCYLILALIQTFNSSSFNSLIELRAASILIFTGTLIPPPANTPSSFWIVERSPNHTATNMVSFRGQQKLGPRPDRSPLGV